MKGKAYPKYRRSDVEWLGEVPEHWGTLPLRRLIRTVKTGGTPTGAEDSAFDDEGFNWYSPSDFSESLVLNKSNRALSVEGKKEVRVFPKMTVMLVGIGATIGKVGLSMDESSCNQQINGIVCGDLLDPLFAAYYMKTLRNFIVKCGKYTTLPIINQDETKNLIFTCPPLPEQQTIADYLDRKTSKIDMLIEKKEQLIARLKEKRTALISRVVTKGLDPKVKLKPSGVEWLGDVPKNWVCSKIKLEILKKNLLIQDGNHGELHPTADDYVNEGIPFVMANHIERGIINFDLCNYIEKKLADGLRIGFAKEGDVLLTHKGTIGRVGFIDDNEFPYIMLTPQVTYYRCIKKIYNRFMFYYMQGKTWQDQMRLLSSVGSTRAYIGLIEQKNMLFVYPRDFNEQQDIADYLDRETGKINALIEKVVDAVAKLREYRTALISAAVTGKIDVRAASLNQ